MEYLKKHTTHISAAILIILCFALFFVNLGAYSFLDTDETKLVSVAKDMLNSNDWLNTKLNGSDFFECPPFLFWIINIFCILFAKISEETVRLPVAFICSFGILFMFFSLKSILTKFYSFLITLIFLTSLGIIVFSRLATADIVYVMFSMSAVLCAYRALLGNKQNNGFLYLSSFLVSCATMTAGLMGILLPFSAIVTMYIFAGRLKELFNFRYVFWSCVLFSFIVFPWHIYMIMTHGMSFVKEYLSVYNFTNYFSLKNVFVSFLYSILGFLPWTFSFIWIIGRRFKSIVISFFSYFKDNSQEKLHQKWDKLSKTEKFVSVNTIVFFTAFLFAFLWGAKLSYLILFQIFPASCISGYYWYRYIVNKQHDKSIFFAILIPDLFFIVCSLIGLFGHNFINTVVLGELNHLFIPLIIIFFALPAVGIIAVLLKGRVQAFVSNIILMILLSFVLSSNIFNFVIDIKGERDLITFALSADKEKAGLVAFIPSKKYSIPYYYDKPVKFYKDTQIEELGGYMKEHPEDYVLTEIKNLWNVEKNSINYMLVNSGRRYCMIKYLEGEPEKEEAEIITF